MTTIDELLDIIYLPMRDAERQYMTEEEAINYINEAIKDLCIRERLYEVESQETVTSGKFAVPTTCIQSRWVYWDDAEGTWLTHDIFRSMQVDNPSLSEDAFLICTIEDEVQFWPMPDDGTEVDFGYWAVPSPVTTGGSTFPLNLIWEARVVNFVRYKGYLHQSETTLASAALSDYEEGLRKPAGSNDRRLPGRLRMARAMGPFDIDPEAAHLGGNW